MNFKNSMTILMVLGLALTAGCARHRKSIPCNTPVSEQDQPWQTRLCAAMRISSFVTRDETLSQIAIEAAEQGNLKYTLKALNGFTSYVSHDRIADKAVTLYLDMNRPEAANKIARTIESFTSRDRALVRIAKHPIDPPASTTP